MKVKFESKGGFDNVLKYFQKVSNIDEDFFKTIAENGITKLKENTPKETGETASGWKYDIIRKKNSLEIDWKNVANPESEVNVAKLIELGHGTGTGGYVQPKPYIKQSMTPIWSKIDKEIEELIK